jgi:hypothetical protein
MVEKYICPVCGFGMEDPPRDYNICPCCGTEFGNHDVNSSIAAIRSEWLRAGAKWWSTVDEPPHGWDPYRQIGNALVVSPLQSIFGSHSPHRSHDDYSQLARMAAGSNRNTSVAIPGLGETNKTHQLAA